MRRFFFILPAIWLLAVAPASAVATANLAVVQPGGPLSPGSACAGPHPTLLVSVKNLGSVANAAVASPDGASIAGGTLAGYAALPAIAPGATATLRFTVVSTSQPKNSQGLITLSVQLDPKHRAGLPPNATDVPALLESQTCAASASDVAGVSKSINNLDAGGKGNKVPSRPAPATPKADSNLTQIANQNSQDGNANRPAPPASKNLELSPDHIGTYEQTKSADTGLFGPALKGLLDPLGLFRDNPNSHGWIDGSALTGYEHRTHKSDLGDSSFNMLARAAVHFDTAALKGHNIANATLTLAVDYAYTGRGNTPQKSQESCAYQVAPATKLWWDETTGLFDFDEKQAVNASSGQTVTIDVTRVVGNWAKGAVNDGFVLYAKAGDENLTAFFESSCLSKYQRVSLAVKYI